LEESALDVAESAERMLKYIASSTLSKEDLMQELLRWDNITEGFVCELSCVEPCQSCDIRRNPETKHIDLVSALRKCLHWHRYVMNSMLSLRQMRIQSWQPFTVHVCINGRE